ncbi:metallophosphoesterase [Spirochaetia bacterium 38H-sp]|uniref:Metallophosphoesterase n=1 Tax=Rarispira pelagica TaxID=3141764 RepID=A0ABU9UBU5_9SPIR
MDSISYSRLSPLEKLEIAIDVVRNMDTSMRPLNSDGNPGGLVEFSDDDDREIIIIGDLHANKNNLKRILMDSGNLAKLRDNRAVLVFLGDIIHDDRSGYMREMESSIKIMEVTLHLLERYPNNVVYILGNHETMNSQIAKHGIQQGLEYRRALVEYYGEEYANLMQVFFDSLPVFVKHPYFLATHAGPPRGGITREEIINIDHFPNLKHQLLWNRLNELRSTPSMKEYGEEDIVETRRLLGCPENIPFIVGHNPMWKWGGDDSIWINPVGTKNHIILYSNLPKKCPYLVFKDSMQYIVKYADLRLKKRRFVLDDYA